MGKQYICGSCGQAGHNKRFHTQTKTQKKIIHTNTKNTANTKKISKKSNNNSTSTQHTKSNIENAYEKFNNMTVDEENSKMSANYDFEELFPSNNNIVSDSELEEIYQSGRAETSYDVNRYREHEDNMRRLKYVRTKVTYYTDQYLEGKMSRTEHYRKVESLATKHGFLLEEVYDA